MYIAAQAYPWMQMFEKRGVPFDLDRALVVCRDAGFDGWEPFADSVADVEKAAGATRRYGLEIRTAYLNLVLHDSRIAADEIDRTLRIARAAADAGTRVFVVNPTPLDWTEPLNKSDDQLSVQLDALAELAGRLHELGVTLAYHTHASEMRAGARELHHMLINGDPDTVTWCVDADWIYRGADRSVLAAYDIARLYGTRASVLHLRQSQNGTWLTRVADGDIDYRLIHSILAERGADPLLVVEQIPPDPSAALDTAMEDYAASRAQVTRWFG